MGNSTTKFCLACNSEFVVTSQHPNVKCCSHQCSVQLKKKREIRTCPCGKEFETTINWGAKYCSAACGFKYRPKPGIKAQKICICEWCKQEFTTWNSRPGRFCSSQCRSEFGARQAKPRATPEELVTIYCEFCNNEYTVPRKYYEIRGSRYCSKSCYSQGASEERHGAGNPNYSGGSSWSRQRKLAKLRDGGKCQICGTRDKKRRISVHHITPYRVFAGDHLAANVLSNLITLCQKCHNQVERHGKPCPRRLL
jgi:hypothetical protein